LNGSSGTPLRYRTENRQQRRFTASWRNTKDVACPPEISKGQKQVRDEINLDTKDKEGRGDLF